MISNNVVIMTRDEFTERLEKEFRRGAESALDDPKELYKRAALDMRDTGVTYSTDGVGRIQVTSARENDLGDCLSIGWMPEAGQRGLWFAAHFSPARARIIARNLILRATLLEEQNGIGAIDPIPEVMRKGPIGVESLGGNYRGADQPPARAALKQDGETK